MSSTILLSTALQQLTTPIVTRCLASDGTTSNTRSNTFDINVIKVTADSSGVSQAGKLVNLLNVEFNAGGPTANGAFNALQTCLNINATTANTTGADYVGHLCIAQSGHNDNGTVGTPLGNLFGRNANVHLGANATFWKSIVGDEIDIAVDAAGSVTRKIGLQIVQTTADGATASVENIACTLSNQAATLPGWDVGYCLGNFDGFNPVNSGGTLIGSWAHADSGGPGNATMNSTVKFGIDLSQYVFSMAPIVMPQQTPATSTSTAKIGSICWDGSFVYVATGTNAWKRAALSTW